MEEFRTLEELEEGIMKNGKKYVLIDVYGRWCKRCKEFLPTLKRISEKYSDVDFKKINIENFDNFTEKYDIIKLPSFIIYKKGCNEPLKIILGPKEHEIEKELSLLTKEISIDINF